jgi:GTP cyclohydrolase I
VKGSKLGLFAQGVSALCTLLRLDARISVALTAINPENCSQHDPKNKPQMALFDNKYKYQEMLVEKDITFYSNCEHHFVPIMGKAHGAYISNGKVIGLSKINRIVQYFSKRPQVQERLTVQIANELKRMLNTKDVAIVIDAVHLCVSSRGVEDINSKTVTSHYSGAFKNEDKRQEFLTYISM